MSRTRNKLAIDQTELNSVSHSHNLDALPLRLRGFGRAYCTFTRDSVGCCCGGRCDGLFPLSDLSCAALLSLPAAPSKHCTINLSSASRALSIGPLDLAHTATIQRVGDSTFSRDRSASDDFERRPARVDFPVPIQESVAPSSTMTPSVPHLSSPAFLSTLKHQGSVCQDHLVNKVVESSLGSLVHPMIRNTVVVPGCSGDAGLAFEQNRGAMSLAIDVTVDDENSGRYTRCEGRYTRCEDRMSE